MKIGILQCDEVPDVGSDQFPDYPEMFKTLLLATKPDLEFCIFRLFKDEFPTDLDVCDAYLFTGSRCSVYDDKHWINKSKQLVRTLYAQQKKVIGICFGHQLIAEALGGKTEKSPNGWGIGVQTWALTEELCLAGKFLKQFSLLTSHQDQVTQLPNNAIRLAGSDFCPNAAFQIDELILCFQGHPEFTTTFSRALMESRRARIGSQQVDIGIDSLSQSNHSTAIAVWMHDFLSA